MTADVQIFEFKTVRKKPVEVEAFQLSNDIWWNIYDLTEHNQIKINGHILTTGGCEAEKSQHFYIHTLEGEMRAELNDWLIRGVNGEIYACKPDIFEKTYDLL